MDFYEVVKRAATLLQEQGKLTYRTLKRQFALDDEALEDLKDELLFSHPVVDEASRGLVWTDTPLTPEPDERHEAEAELRFRSLLQAVISLLKSEGRVTYRILKHIPGLDDTLLAEIRKELRLRRLAVDEEGEVLVWTCETPPSAASGKVAPSPQNTTAMVSPAVPANQPWVTATDTTTNEPPASPEDAPVESSSAEQITAPEPTRSAPEAERRQLTVMFCDLVGSTDLSSRLDPEDLREVVRAYQETAAEVIERYEGHIAQYLGDGLLIYFGYPVAHEDDAQRAVHTGLGIVEAMSTLNMRLKADCGVELAVRLGTHTGLVVVGEMGGGDRHENLALGETPNIAARLEGLARPGTSVISAVTAQLVQRSFALEELGRHDLKGVAESMMLYAVIGSRESDHNDHDVIRGGGFDTLEGRDEEIGLLRRRWEQSKAGLGQVVLLSGEAGVGKSSLVEGLRGHVRQEGLTHLAIRCSPYHTNSAFYPIIEHIQRVLDWQPDDDVDTRLSKLEQTLKRTSRGPQEAVPLLAGLLSFPLPKARYPALALNPQEQRQQTLHMVVAWWLEEAERQPLLAVWEDLHWADTTTLELLGILIDQVPTVPMMNVLAYRPVFAPPWTMQSHLTPIALNRLERSHVEALVSRLAGSKSLPTEVMAHIVAKTDGIPLYVEELTKMLLESDLLVEQVDAYVLTGPLSRASIPATLQDSLMARLDRLPQMREVAQLGAVFGREFAYDMLQALAVMDDLALQEGLRQLVTHELLYQRGRERRAAYTFRHALIQEAAYQSLLRRTRQQYHQQVAALFETQFPEILESQPELLAHHYTEAGRIEAAVVYWQQAGQRALERSAYVEAITHLTQGITLIRTLPETPERLQQELDMQVALGPPLRATQGNASSEAERAYARAQELCQQIGDSPQLFPVLRGLMLYYQGQGQWQTAYRLGEQLLRLAQSESESEHLFLGYFMLGQVAHHLANLSMAQTHYTQALVIYKQLEPQDLALRYGTDLGGLAYAQLAWVLWLLGYPDQARQYSQEALTLAQHLSHPYSQAQALLLATVLHLHRRDVPAARRHAEAAMTLAPEQGFARHLSMVRVFRGWARVMQGESQEGTVEIHQGYADYLATDSKVRLPHFLSLLAEVAGRDGQPEVGLSALQEAIAITNATEERLYEAELYRLKGVLILQQAAPDVSEAERCFDQSLEIARRQQAKSFELRTATSLAKLWQALDKCQDAYDLLAPVYNWFTEGFDTADLQEAKTLLEELAEVAS